jgi:branched-chain amino acid transport system substrate-binding protein
MKRAILRGFFAAALFYAGAHAAAAGPNAPGVSDTEIKLGNTMPYSGPASGLGTLGKAEAGYFAMINDRGGVNGRNRCC